MDPPSSLFLLAVPFTRTFGWAVALLLARECLVEMDVPTRQSYILAVVQPNERTCASERDHKPDAERRLGHRSFIRWLLHAALGAGRSAVLGRGH